MSRQAERAVENIRILSGAIKRHRTYTIRLMGPAHERRAVIPGDVLSEAEENISDLLPEGYYCKIEED